MEENKKTKNIKLTLYITLILCLMVGASYATYNLVLKGNKQHQINIGSLTLTYEETNNINVTGDTIKTDEEGIASENYFGFNLSVTATGTIKLYYYIYFTVDPTSTLGKDAVKVNLTQAESDSSTIASETEIVNPTYISDLTSFNLETFKYDKTSNDYLLYLDNFEFANSSTAKKRYYRFRMWYSPKGTSNVNITETEDGNHQAVISGGKLKLKVNIYSSQSELKMITKS